MSKNPLNDLGTSLGDYLREQRQSARLSLRQLGELAGVSNPYLSQIERGLKRPSAEILQQLAKGLEVSAESLYIKAGILDAETVTEPIRTDVRSAINDDHILTARQKAALLDVYESFVGAASDPSKVVKTTTSTKTVKPRTADHKTAQNKPAQTRNTKEK